VNLLKYNAIFICCILFAACTQSTPQPTDFPPATPSPQPTPTPTYTPQATDPEPPSNDQELLKEEWRIPIENAIVLFTTCTFMFETHSDFQQGEIDLAAAKDELSLAADFLAFAEWFSPESYRSETSAALMLDLELNMRALIEWYDATGEEDFGTQETLDALFPICEMAQTLQTKVVFTAMDAGLTEEDISELDPSDTEWLTYYYDQIMFDE
jgi:hypothetical protein